MIQFDLQLFGSRGASSGRKGGGSGMSNSPEYQESYQWERNMSHEEAAVPYALPSQNRADDWIETQMIDTYGNDADAITKALNDNRDYLDARFAAELHGYLIKAMAGFLATLPVLLAVPLLNRNRATPGKLMTGIMPFHDRRQRRAVWYQILFRFLFVFLIDGMGLYLLTGIWTFILVPVLRLIEILCSRKDKTFSDMMTSIMIIEKLSYSGIN